MATSKEKLIIELKAKGISLTKNQLKQLDKSTDGATKSFGAMAVGIAGATAALYAMGKATSFAIRVGKEFEQGMANVKAISGATGAEFKALEANARKLGASTKFTATEVAGLQTEFSKLGFTATEINKVTAGTLALAAATGSDLATSAAVGGATLRGFGLDAKETGRVTDVMAKSFSSSALDMQKFQDSMKYVAPVAKIAGFGIEGTTAILGKLANAGIDGSMAGTSLRKVFLELSNENSKLAKRLGGSVSSIDELIPALQKLNAEGVSTAEMKDLVGQRAISAFSILLDGAEDLDTLTESFRNAGGAAQTMADIQLDTLEGKMTIMKSATEGLGIALFDHMSPALNDVVEGMTKLIGKTTDWIAIPAEENIRREMVEFNSLMISLRDVNLLEDNRKKIIAELQTKYGSYLKNVDLEKGGYDELTKSLEKANEEFLRKIRIQAQASLIEKQETKIANLMEEQIELAMKFQDVKQGEFDIWDMIYGQMRTVTEQSGRWKEINEEIPAEIQEQMEKIARIKTIIEELSGKKTVEIEVKTGDGKDGVGDNGEPPIISGVPTEDQVNEALDFMKQFQESNLFIQEEAHLQEAIAKKASMEQLLQIEEFYNKKHKKLQDQKLHTTLGHYSQLAGGTSAFLKNFAGGEKAAARIQQVKVGIDTVSATMKAFAKGGGWPGGLIPAAASAAYGAAQMMAISQSIGEFKHAQTGMDEIITQPTLIMAGEGGKAEHIGITPLEGPNLEGPQGGGSVTVNVSGNVMSQDYVEGELAEQIKEAIRRGNDFGIS